MPVVALPLGRDQLDNAARVAHHGAGLRLKPKAKPEAIAKAVRRVLEEPSFAAAAERIAAAIAAETAEGRGGARGARRRGLGRRRSALLIARLVRCR